MGGVFRFGLHSAGFFLNTLPECGLVDLWQIVDWSERKDKSQSQSKKNNKSQTEKEKEKEKERKKEPANTPSWLALFWEIRSK